MRAISWTLLLLAAVACTAAEDMPGMDGAPSETGSLMERLTKIIGDIDQLSDKYKRHYGYKGYHSSYEGILRGTQYLVFKYDRTYDEAKEVCQGIGGTLADITSEAIHNFVEGLVRKVDAKKSYWIGLNDMATEGVWAWSDGTPVTQCGYTNWSPGQPDNFLWSQDCGRLWDWTNFKWDDANCADKYHFVCQIRRGRAAFRC